VSLAASAEQALQQAAADPPDIAFLDVRLPGLGGLEALERLRALCPRASFVVMTAHGTMSTAVETFRAGALDYLPKPFDLEQARRLIERAGESRPVRGTTAAVPDREPPALLGRGAAMQRVFRQVALAAASEAPVLITGESGTGKELVARAVHQHGPRPDRPFVPVHLAALPEALLERELFGHERGAFTGADRSRPGLIEEAGAGTLFLDEVAEAPASVQVKLLRVLDSGDYRPVGGGAERRLAARVVAATNRDMAAQVRSGAFRADLYYRLAVLTIVVPPLRDRPEDIPLLWDAWVERIAPGVHEPLGGRDPLLAALRARAWPGNVRELRNVAEHAVRAAAGSRITPEMLPESLGSAPALADGGDGFDAAVRAWTVARLGRVGGGEGDLHGELVDRAERVLLEEAWRWSGGNQARMARRLGLHRTTLREKLRRHGLPGGGESEDPGGQ
jgi:two-component system nitrogen regulation response regulator GlnG